MVEFSTDSGLQAAARLLRGRILSESALLSEYPKLASAFVFGAATEKSWRVTGGRIPYRRGIYLALLGDRTASVDYMAEAASRMVAGSGLSLRLYATEEYPLEATTIRSVESVARRYYCSVEY